MSKATSYCSCIPPPKLRQRLSLAWNFCRPTCLARPDGASALASLEACLAPSEECRDAFLVILGQARQRELVDVHVAGEVVERMRQTIDGQLGHGDRERRL